jgi:hypothetical protein
MDGLSGRLKWRYDDGSALMTVDADGSRFMERVVGWCAPCWEASATGMQGCDWPECPNQDRPNPIR